MTNTQGPRLGAQPVRPTSIYVAPALHALLDRHPAGPTTETRGSRLRLLVRSQHLAILTYGVSIPGGSSPAPTAVTAGTTPVRGALDNRSRWNACQA